MIEVCITFDLQPGINQQAWAALSQKGRDAVLQAPGLVEFRAYRNMLGSPHRRATHVWHTLGDWGTLSESAAWQAFDAESRAFTTNVRVEIWGPSPVVPAPLRPGR